LSTRNTRKAEGKQRSSSKLILPEIKHCFNNDFLDSKYKRTDNDEYYTKLLRKISKENQKLIPKSTKKSNCLDLQDNSGERVKNSCNTLNSNPLKIMHTNIKRKYKLRQPMSANTFTASPVAVLQKDNFNSIQNKLETIKIPQTSPLKIKQGDLINDEILDEKEEVKEDKFKFKEKKEEMLKIPLNKKYMFGCIPYCW